MVNLKRSINVVGVHAEGEQGHVITGGFRTVKGATMVDKMSWMVENHEDFRRFMMSEPRAPVNRNTNLITAPVTEDGDLGLLIMETEEYAPMSGSNIMCTTTVVLETGMFEMKEPETILRYDTAAGRAVARAQCKDGKVERVTVFNVPCFVFDLDVPIDVPGMGTVLLDAAFGGMNYCFISAESLGIEITNDNGAELVRIAEKIKRAARLQYVPCHPEQEMFSGIQNLVITGPIVEENGVKTSKNATVLSPGRLDRSPCGTGTSARLAVMHARGLIKEGETFLARSPIGSEFVARIEGVTTVAGRPAIKPSLTGRAWITEFSQYVLDPTDPFSSGFRCGDLWPAQTEGSLNKPQIRQQQLPN